MKRLAASMLAAAVATAVAATPVLASETLCTASASQAKPKEELQHTLEAAGWQVNRIKEEHGCYEVYAYNPEGDRVEALFDPATLKMVKANDDD